MSVPPTHMDYDEVGSLAEAVATAATTISTAHTALAESPAPTVSIPVPYVDPWNAFGNTDSAAATSSAYYEARRAALSAVANLSAILTGDNKRLIDTITCFQSTDHESADRICSGNNLNVYSSHVHSGGGEDNDLIRAGHIDDLRSHIDGPAVIGADLNAVADGSSHSAEAINAFEDQGYEVHSGGRTDSGEVVGTFNGREIDYVITSPAVSANQPELVDATGVSDHHGLLTELTVHDWG